MFLWWRFCGGVFVFVCWCFCGGVCVLVFLWWCFCGGVFVAVFLWWCFCGGVFVVVWWCLYFVVRSSTIVETCCELLWGKVAGTRCEEVLW